MSRPLRFLADLTPAMSKALVRCHATVIPVDADHGIHRTTLAALQRHDLVHETRDKRMRRTWKPTVRGMHIIQTQEPHLLRAGVFGGYTTEPEHALPGEPEAVEPLILQEFAAAARRSREVVAAEDILRDRARSLSRRVRDETLRAGRAGVDITVELAQVEQQLQAIQRKREIAA